MKFYYVCDGAEMHYFDSRFLARLFYEVGFDNDNSPYACLWEFGYINRETGYGLVLASHDCY